jgi:hypothetical protein
MVGTRGNAGNAAIVRSADNDKPPDLAKLEALAK